MSEQRESPRRRMFKAGVIELGIDAIDCVVRNLSETGAQLAVASPTYIPDRFTLSIISDEIRRTCRVVWKNGKRMGVVFEPA